MKPDNINGTPVLPDKLFRNNTICQRAEVNVTHGETLPGNRTVARGHTGAQGGAWHCLVAGCNSPMPAGHTASLATKPAKVRVANAVPSILASANFTSVFPRCFRPPLRAYPRNTIAQWLVYFLR